MNCTATLLYSLIEVTSMPYVPKIAPSEVEPPIRVPRVH